MVSGWQDLSFAAPVDRWALAQGQLITWQHPLSLILLKQTALAIPAELFQYDMVSRRF